MENLNKIFMKVNNILFSSVVHAATLAAAGVLVLALLFMSFEPTVIRAQSDSSTLTVSQIITDEISISVASSTLTLTPSLTGLTGGTANASTDVVVTTNSTGGYTMTIQFSSSTAMYKNGGGSGAGSIYNYVSTSTADITFDTSQVYSQFAYSAYSATDAGDIDTTFLDNTSVCGAGSNATAGNCWLAPSSTFAEQIVNRTSQTGAGGATTTVQFRVYVPSNPSPTVPTGTYTATATLTATVQ